MSNKRTGNAGRDGGWWGPHGPAAPGRNRALEVLLSSEDISGDRAEAYGYVNRALLDAELDAFVEALAIRIAKFDKWAIANTDSQLRDGRNVTFGARRRFVCLIKPVP
jgi:enoyl-CoA hydratase/carnithine racemase